MDHHHEVFHSFQFQVRFATMKGWQELVDEKETDISWGFAVLWHRTLTSKAPHLSEAFLDGYKLLRTRVLCHQAWLGTFCLEHTRGIVRDGIRAHLFHSLEGVSEPVRLLLMLCCVACCAIHGDNFAESLMQCYNFRILSLTADPQELWNGKILFSVVEQVMESSRMLQLQYSSARSACASGTFLT